MERGNSLSSVGGSTKEPFPPLWSIQAEWGHCRVKECAWNVFCTKIPQILLAGKREEKAEAVTHLPVERLEWIPQPCRQEGADIHGGGEAAAKSFQAGDKQSSNRDESAATGSSKTFWKLPLAGLGRLQLFWGRDEVESDKGRLSVELEWKNALKKIKNPKRKEEICAGLVRAKA